MVRPNVHGSEAAGSRLRQNWRYFDSLQVVGLRPGLAARQLHNKIRAGLDPFNAGRRREDQFPQPTGPGFRAQAETYEGNRKPKPSRPDASRITETDLVRLRDRSLVGVPRHNQAQTGRTRVEIEPFKLVEQVDEFTVHRDDLCFR
jgi:hypothetical protein